MTDSTREEKIVLVRQKFHDLSNSLGLIVMRGELYSKSIPREFENTTKLKEWYNKSLDEHGKSHQDGIKAAEVMADMRKLIYDLLQVDTSKPIK